MLMIDLIRAKRDGKAHAPGEIKSMVQAYTQGDIPDYQMAAWCMAVYFKGLNPAEQSELTMAMAYSGETLDLSPISGIKVDKHSTGGVGDKTTLILAPLVAAAGLPVVKMSGRALGHTGGTIDKLESIPGFRTAFDLGEIIRQVKETGLALAGQTGHLVPADKKLYALRDATGAVESIPLIASSVMSKKIAAGADAVVLDVKAGNGAFVKTAGEAEFLARSMVEIGRHVGKKTVALITGMDQPLGCAVGNALEVKEAIRALQGSCPADLEELCMILGCHMLLLGERCKTMSEAEKILRGSWKDGQALAKFQQLVTAQGGPADLCCDPDKYLPRAAKVDKVKSPRDGYIAGIDTYSLGLAAGKLGAGRTEIGAAVFPDVGLIVRKKTGDKVCRNECLCELHARDGRVAEMVRITVREAFSVSDKPVCAQKLLKGIII
ncbi:MAG: thymidine phosphorylase [Bacillota bacterium]